MESTQTDSARPLMSRTLILFLSTMIFANIAGRMFDPYMPLYLQSLGASVTQVGMVFTITMLAPLAFKILGGWVSDTIGRLQAIVIGSLAGSAGYVFFIFADHWGWVLAGLAVSSLSGAFVAPSFQAYVAEQADPKRLGRAYGLTEGLFSVVGIIGPLLGGFFSQRFGFRALFMAAGAVYFAATLIRIVMARRDSAHRSRNDNALRNTAQPAGGQRKLSWKGLKANLGEMIALVTAGGLVTWMLVFDGVLDVSFSVQGQFQPIYLQDLMGFVNSQIGVLVSIGSAATMVVMLLGGGLSDKLGERVCIIAGGLSVVAGMGLFLLTKNFTWFVVSFGLVGIGGGLFGPAYNSLVSKAVPARLRGTAFGLFSTSIGIISLPAPLIGGIMWEQIGPWAPFLVPVIAILLMVPVVWAKFVLPKEKEADAGNGLATELSEG